MKAAFAIPGDKDRRTGGFIYEATVLRVLNEIGCPTAHLELRDSFPEPPAADMVATLDTLRAVPRDQAIILDGLVYGAIDPDGLATVPAPLIAMIHHPLGLETGIDPALAQHLLANEAAALQHASAIVVPSPHTADILSAQFGADPAKITIALPGFDRPIRDPHPQNPPLIISVGILADRKGHDVLLAALAQIKDVPWQAEIIGKQHDPGTAKALLEHRDQLGLSDRVSFLGEADKDTLNNRYNAASIFALATRYEGYGMVLSEAMLYGLPVVSTQTGAVPETVGEAGVLVPVNDADALGKVLRDLLSDDAMQENFGQRSLAKSASLPTWEDTARIMANVIAQVRGAV